ncbi:MAG: site-specific integrase [Planctomyces sp.]|nr:site-specific integrase [Planctomyces sp.]
MPRRKTIPSYLHHRATGQARVRIDGRDFYLGAYGSDASRRRYGELIAKHCSGVLEPPGDPLSPSAGESGPSVAEIVLAFLRHAEGHYRKNGRPTSQVHLFKNATGPLVRLYGLSPAEEFGPAALRAVRLSMIDDRRWCRSTINSHVARIRQVFKFAVEHELIPAETLNRLRALAPLLAGRTAAPDHAPVMPVPEADVNAILPHVSRQVRDMIRLQLLSGCRPDEIVSLRPCDVNREGEVWEYAPASHKTQHHGRQRRIYFGPRAQAILAPYLDDRSAEAACFSPAEAEAERLALKRQKRKSKVQPSQAARTVRKRQRAPAATYTVASYRRAIHRACKAAGVAPWAPNRLRHSRATDLRRRYGIEAAQTVCGHSKLDTTQVYAERDLERARSIMAECG